jgi:hypothetical protein
MKRLTNETIDVCRKTGLFTLNNENKTISCGVYGQQILQEFKKYWLKSNLNGIGNAVLIDEQVCHNGQMCTLNDGM